MNINDCREIHKEGRADTQFEQRKFDAIGRLLLEVDRLSINDETLRALLDWRMCSDPWPGGTMEIVDKFLNNISMTAGYVDWVDAYHNHYISGVFQKMSIADDPKFPELSIKVNA